jgi:hypothetical protein
LYERWTLRDRTNIYAEFTVVYGKKAKQRSLTSSSTKSGLDHFPPMEEDLTNTVISLKPDTCVAHRSFKIKQYLGDSSLAYESASVLLIGQMCVVQGFLPAPFASKWQKREFLALWNCRKQSAQTN